MIQDEDKFARERLVALGVGALDNAGVLGILLGEGSTGSSATELARAVLSEAGEGRVGCGNKAPAPFATLAAMDIKKLRMVAGIGAKRAAVLAAAFEAGRRAAREETAMQETISGDADVVRIFRPLLGGLPHEEFWVLYLSSANRIIERVRIGQGGVCGTIVDHKLIVKRALEHLSPAIVVVHNHPSGVAEPSEDDKTLTATLLRAAALFDITLVDHIIVTSGPSFSFRREGLLG